MGAICPLHSRLDYLNSHTPYAVHWTSVSKVWRPQSCPVLRSAFPSTHRQNQPATSIHRTASHTRLLQLFGIWVKVNISKNPVMLTLSAKFSLSPSLTTLLPNATFSSTVSSPSVIKCLSPPETSAPTAHPGPGGSISIPSGLRKHSPRKGAQTLSEEF